MSLLDNPISHLSHLDSTHCNRSQKLTAPSSVD
jgi:hypothetical protein